VGFITPQTYIQDPSLAGSDYRIFIEISPVINFQWEALIQKDGATVYRETFSCEAEAKETAHRWAYADSGDHKHSCDQTCMVWELKELI
jgi:hypothetical protein